MTSRRARNRRDKRQPIRAEAANDETPQTWADFYAELDKPITRDNYEREQIASATSGTDTLNGTRG